MKRRAIVLVVLLSFFLGVTETVMAQCSMCKSALVQSPEGQQMASSMNNGILFLLSVPFVLVATVGLVVVRGYRKAKKLNERASPASDSASVGR